MSNLRKLARTDPDSLWLKCPIPLQKEAWDKSLNHSSSTARNRAYINFLCLNTLLPWLEDWFEEEQSVTLQVFQEESLSSFWEVVNGTAIDIGGTRLILLPSETTDLEQFCIPQEWVNIPSWQGDYYLAIQINLEQKDYFWIRIWGLAPYSTLKSLGNYDESECVYSIEQDYLYKSFTKTLLDVKPAQQRAKRGNRKLDLSPNLAEYLLQQLGDREVYFPRLVVQSESKFDLWEALLANPKWREELYLRRTGQWSLDRALPPLHQWFETNNPEIVQDLKVAGWWRDRRILDPQETVTLAWRFVSNSQPKNISWVKQIDSEIKFADCPIALIMRLTRDSEDRIWILPILRPMLSVGRDLYLPEGLTLTVLQTGKVFARVRAETADCWIHLDEEFTDFLGSTFSIRVSLEQIEIMTLNFAV
ncbi:MAG: DUF1822 family protein [Cyanobacteriota bacterium]|nr:DUF1822 family protein [Cyanobacteriota bacterium]